nr:MAG TPA: hypothetical protein [Bacteriophage sp.]
MISMYFLHIDFVYLAKVVHKKNRYRYLHKMPK